MVANNFIAVWRSAAMVANNSIDLIVRVVPFGTLLISTNSVAASNNKRDKWWGGGLV
jgi:hypothetical protein